MKIIKTGWIFAGLSLFVCAGLYCQTGNRAIDGWMNTERQREQNASAYNNQRKVNRYTTKTIYVIYVDGSPAWYYAENEYKACLSDYDMLKKEIGSKVAFPRKVNNPRYSGNASVNQGNSMPQMFDNSNDTNTPTKSFFSTSSNAKGNFSTESLIVSSDKDNDAKTMEELLGVDNNNTGGLDSNTSVVIRNDYPILPEVKLTKTDNELIGKEYQPNDDEKLQLWSKIFEDINNKQRFTTVMNQLITLNSGKIPDYVGFVSNAYVFKDKSEASYFFVSPNGTYMEKVTTNGLKLDGAPVPAVSLAGVDMGISNNKIELNSEEKKQIKEWGNTYKDEDKTPKWLNSGLEWKIKATSNNIETTQIFINEDGSAIKGVITLDGPNIGGSLNVKANDLSVEGKMSLMGAEASTSYIRAPKLDVNNINGSLNINQQEIGIKIGADAGVKGKLAVGKEGAEVSAIVTAGVVWENYETKQNFNQLPQAIANRTYLDYLDDRKSIVYSRVMESNWGDNKSNTLRGTYPTVTEQDIEKAIEKTRNEIIKQL